MARRKTRKLSKKEQKAKKKADAVVEDSRLEESSIRQVRDKIKVSLPATITVSEFAKRSTRTPAEIVQTLIKNGVVATMNDSIDRETAEIIAPELDLEIASEETASTLISQSEEDLKIKPPVVTVMGHVDHGKTSLLDAIRKTKIAAGESGGITQHIGAYQVSWKPEEQSSSRLITFIDTPGHEAFSAMRAHGANITDLAIIVVAADDGVMPQTKEALSHARAAEVPIIVAITKVDKPEANPDKVKGDLAEIGLTPEDWGGKTPVVAVSAVTGDGINDLLDTILLVADVNEFKARASGPAVGVVIEAHKSTGIGPVATVLVQEGQLAVGDSVVVGQTHGKVRFLEDENKHRHQEVGPATPVRVAGLASVPSFGDQLRVVETEKQARALAQTSASKQVRHLALPDVSDNSLPVVVKADVDGSAKAIEQALESIKVENVQVKVIYAGVGKVTDADVHMAIAASGYLVAFNVGFSPTSRQLIDRYGVTAKAYSVIYDLIEDITAAAQGALETEIVDVEVGRLKVLGVFRTTKSTKIIGGQVEDGKAAKNATVKVLRSGEEIATGQVESLQRGQTSAEEVLTGEQCGLSVKISAPIEIGDVLAFYTKEERIKKKEIASSESEDEDSAAS